MASISVGVIWKWLNKQKRLTLSCYSCYLFFSTQPPPLSPRFGSRGIQRADKKSLCLPNWNTLLRYKKKPKSGISSCLHHTPVLQLLCRFFILNFAAEMATAGKVSTLYYSTHGHLCSHECIYVHTYKVYTQWWNKALLCAVQICVCEADSVLVGSSCRAWMGVKLIPDDTIRISSNVLLCGIQLCIRSQICNVCNSYSFRGAWF